MCTHAQRLLIFAFFGGDGGVTNERAGGWKMITLKLHKNEPPR